jgi:hypothetical protein
MIETHATALFFGVGKVKKLVFQAPLIWLIGWFLDYDSILCTHQRRTTHHQTYLCVWRRSYIQFAPSFFTHVSAQLASLYNLNRTVCDKKTKDNYCNGRGTPDRIDSNGVCRCSGCSDGYIPTTSILPITSVFPRSIACHLSVVVRRFSTIISH